MIFIFEIKSYAFLCRTSTEISAICTAQFFKNKNKKSPHRRNSRGNVYGIPVSNFSIFARTIIVRNASEASNTNCKIDIEKDTSVDNYLLFDSVRCNGVGFNERNEQLYTRCLLTLVVHMLDESGKIQNGISWLPCTVENAVNRSHTFSLTRRFFVLYGIFLSISRLFDGLDSPAPPARADHTDRRHLIFGLIFKRFFSLVLKSVIRSFRVNVINCNY